MNTQDIKELLALQNVLAVVGIDSASPEVLGALLDWKGNGVAKPSAPQQEPAKPVRGKAKASPPPEDPEDPGF